MRRVPEQDLDGAASDDKLVFGQATVQRAEAFEGRAIGRFDRGRELDAVAVDVVESSEIVP